MAGGQPDPFVGLRQRGQADRWVGHHPRHRRQAAAPGEVLDERSDVAARSGDRPGRAAVDQPGEDRCRVGIGEVGVGVPAVEPRALHHEGAGERPVTIDGPGPAAPRTEPGRPDVDERGGRCAARGTPAWQRGSRRAAPAARRIAPPPGGCSTQSRYACLSPGPPTSWVSRFGCAGSSEARIRSTGHDRRDAVEGDPAEVADRPVEAGPCPASQHPGGRAVACRPARAGPTPSRGGRGRPWPGR